MPVLKIEDFSGTVPTMGDRALPQNFAVESYNSWLYSKELVGVHPREWLKDINNTTRKIFRVPKGTSGADPDVPGVPPPSYLQDSIWMQFTDPDTDVVRGPLVNDSHRRFYFCSPTTGLVFNTYARMLSGEPELKVGVIAPTAQPTLIGSGGSGVIVTRSYLYTYENIYGEESGTSPPTTGATYDNGTWSVYWTPPSNADPTYAPCTKVNIYRTITSDAGVSTYFKLVTIEWNGTTGWAPNPFQDVGTTYTSSWLAGNLQLESGAWIPPPAGLQGIIAMPNGFLLSWKGSTVYMSEAYHLHAWPAEYEVSTEYPIVGMGVLGTTAVICTQSFPATLTGVKPVYMSFTKATTNEPCLSRGSIVSTPNGVYYASQNGLIAINASGITNITQQLLTREEWITKYTPTRLRACRYQNGYLAMRDKPDPVLNECFFLDPSALKVALTEYTDFGTATNIFSDQWSGEVFVLDKALVGTNHAVYRWDAPSDDMMPVLWKTKEFQIPDVRNFSAYAIYWDDARYSDWAGGAGILPVGQKVRFAAWCNRVKVYDQVVPENGRGVRLPSGFKGDIWQFEIRARAPVYVLHVANTMKELRGA